MIIRGDLVQIIDNATGEILTGRVKRVTLRTVKVMITDPESMLGDTIVAFRPPIPEGIEDCYVVVDAPPMRSTAEQPRSTSRPAPYEWDGYDDMPPQPE